MRDMKAYRARTQEIEAEAAERIRELERAVEFAAYHYRLRTSRFARADLRACIARLDRARNSAK